MFNFISDYTVNNLRNKLLMLYILNVTDIVFTLLLVNTGYFIEGNVLMVKVVRSPLASLH